MKKSTILREKFLSNPYTQLLIVLISLAFASTFLDGSIGRIILGFILTLVLFIIIHSFYPHKKNYQKAYLIFAILSMLTQILIETQIYLINMKIWAVIIGTVNLTFLGIAIYIIGQRIARARQVNDDILKGGICLYLLLGTWFGLLYEMIYFLNYQSFATTVGNGKPVPFDPLYYSFVTLASLGYGDIIPLGKMARVLSYLEAVIGVLYVSIIVSRLVSLLVADEINKRR